jgi:hypothetical protein
MMKAKAFPTLAGLALLIAMPLSAQTAATDTEVQPAPPAVEESNDNIDVDADLRDAEGNLDPEVDVKTGAEARADVDTAATDNDDADLDADVDADLMADDTVAGADELPRTASPLALLALLGVGAGGSAFGLRRLRR